MPRTVTSLLLEEPRHPSCEGVCATFFCMKKAAVPLVLATPHCGAVTDYLAGWRQPARYFQTVLQFHFPFCLNTNLWRYFCYRFVLELPSWLASTGKVMLERFHVSITLASGTFGSQVASRAGGIVCVALSKPFCCLQAWSTEKGSRDPAGKSMAKDSR